MSDAKNITDPALMAAILGYCKANRIDCWVIHTPLMSTIGGFSERLISINDNGTSTTQLSSGDLRDVMTDELSMRTES